VRPQPTLTRAVLVALIASQTVGLGIWMLDLGVSRMLVLVELALLLVLFVLLVAPLPRAVRTGGALLLLLVAAYPTLLGLVRATCSEEQEERCAISRAAGN